MSTTPNVPRSQETHSYDTQTTPRWIPIVFLVVFVILGYLLFAGYTSRHAWETQQAKLSQKADLLAAQLEQANARVAELKGQLDVTSQKLGLTQGELTRARTMAQTYRKEQQAADEQIKSQLSTQLGQIQQESESKLGKISGDVSSTRSDIEATRKDLEATKGKLERTIGDLGVQSGLIARNREDLEDLKRRGERNIFEFNLQRTKTPQRVGPIQVHLKKLDIKKFRYTMDVYADDKRIEKRDKTVNEPVQFYVKGVRTPYEIVVFEVAKDRATGYLSTPKETAARQP